MFTDVSLDLETLGTKPGSVITQIGLCGFNLDSTRGEDSSAVLIRINPASAMDAGLTIDWPTVAWWMTQKDVARGTMAGLGASDHTLRSALTTVDVWVRDNCTRSFHIWGNGASFDVTLLECAYFKLGAMPPWKFWNIRDLRTLADLASSTVDRVKPEVEHNAMEDAVAQAQWIQNIYRDINARHPRT